MSENAIALYDPLWATIQQGCSVICCCAPIYKPLVPTLGLFTRLRSFSTRTFRKRSGGSSDPEMLVDKLPLDSLQVGATSWEQGSYHSDEHERTTVPHLSKYAGHGGHDVRVAESV